MTEATPGPWQVERDGDGKFLVVAPQEDGNLLITDVLANLTPGQDEAHAVLIVRAVNSLAPLVEALRECVYELNEISGVAEWAGSGQEEAWEHGTAALKAAEEATG